VTDYLITAKNFENLLEAKYLDMVYITKYHKNIANYSKCCFIITALSSQQQGLYVNKCRLHYVKTTSLTFWPKYFHATNNLTGT